jgi:Fe-S cluster biogenesis protein NfuA
MSDDLVIADAVCGILAKVRPYIALHGGDVQVRVVEEGVAFLRVSGACSHCTLSKTTYTDTIAPLLLREVVGLTHVEFEYE